tara:strand:+ start:10422 stop:10940 length:519 start_codon:yes stop_codon:yes gene_type:complete
LGVNLLNPTTRSIRRYIVNLTAKAGTKFDKRGEVELSPFFVRDNTLRNSPLWVNASADNPPNTYLIKIGASFKYNHKCRLVINESMCSFFVSKLLDLGNVGCVNGLSVKILGVTKSFHFSASIRTHSRQYLRRTRRRTLLEIVMGTKFCENAGLRMFNHSFSKSVVSVRVEN